MEILTAQENNCTILRISKRQVYALAKQSENPIPAVRLLGGRTSVRFRKSDVDGWVEGLVENKAACDERSSGLPLSKCL